MPHYVMLMNLTEAGAEDLTEAPEAAREIVDAVRAELEDQEGALHSLLWTTGEYDGVAVVEAPSDRHVAAVALLLARSGLVRTKTLTAFGHAEMEDVVGKLRGGKLRGGKLRGGKLRGGKLRGGKLRGGSAASDDDG
jgi:uncharacterized protein with GYD domain